MKRIWFWRPSWYWHGLRTLLPWYIGGDEYGRRTLMLGWTVTGGAIVAISRPGRLYPPDCWEWEDELTGTIVRAQAYPYGGGVRQHGVQITLTGRTGSVAARIPQEQVRTLAELIGASRSLVWHDPRNADDPFWNPQANGDDEAQRREPWYLRLWVLLAVAAIGVLGLTLRAIAGFVGGVW